jgi:hypothetical protein
MSCAARASRSLTRRCVGAPELPTAAIRPESGWWNAQPAPRTPPAPPAAQGPEDRAGSSARGEGHGRRPQQAVQDVSRPRDPHALQSWAGGQRGCARSSLALGRGQGRRAHPSCARGNGWQPAQVLSSRQLAAGILLPAAWRAHAQACCSTDQAGATTQPAATTVAHSPRQRLLLIMWPAEEQGGACTRVCSQQHGLPALLPLAARRCGRASPAC